MDKFLKSWLSILMGILVGVSFVGAFSTLYSWYGPWQLLIVTAWTNAVNAIFEHVPFETGEVGRLWAACFVLFWGYIFVWTRITLSAKGAAGHVTLYTEDLRLNAWLIILIYMSMALLILFHPIAAIIIGGPYIISAEFKKVFFAAFNVVVISAFAADWIYRFAV